MRAARSTSLVVSACLLFTLASSNWLRNHVFPVSDKAPISRALSKNPAGKAALEGILAYYRTVEQRMRKSDPEDDLREPLIPQLLPFHGWPALSEAKQRIYLPYRQKSGRSDPNVLKFEEEKFKRELRAFRRDERLFFEHVIAFNKAVERTGDAVNKSTVLNWRRYVHYALINFESSTGSDFCEMYANVAYRINGVWGVDATLTNDFREVFKAEGQRRYVHETVYVDQTTGTVQPITRWMNLSAANDTRQFWNGEVGIRDEARTKVTTVVSLWGGRPGVSHFDSKEFEDNAAFNVALESGKHLSRQGRDSKAAANAAILLLPVLMTAFPIALFVDCSDRTTLVFTLITDVLAVVPLLIKGIELLVAGNARYFSTRTMMYGNPAREGTVIAESWAVACRVEHNLVVYGAAFVAIAVVAMILGIALEVIAKTLVKRNSHKAMTRGMGFGMEHIWERGGPCVECHCEERAPVVEDSERSGSSLGGGLIGQIRRRREDARNAERSSSFSSALLGT